VPRIARPMRVDPDDLPNVGTRSKCLGVREPPDAHADVDVDPAGYVKLNRKGLSVVDNWRHLPGHLIPEHLDDGFNGASGKNMSVFVHGTGPFQEGAVAPGLELLHKAGSTRTGVVSPAASVLLREFQEDLAATRNGWVIDES
jgi:hypothetical protein